MVYAGEQEPCQSRNHANLWATIVFGIGDPRLENYRFHGLGMGLAGSKECANLDLA